MKRFVSFVTICLFLSSCIGVGNKEGTSVESASWEESSTAVSEEQSPSSSYRSEDYKYLMKVISNTDELLVTLVDAPNIVEIRKYCYEVSDIFEEIRKKIDNANLSNSEREEVNAYYSEKLNIFSHLIDQIKNR